MILSKKIRLKPNKNQELFLWQSTGTARFIYNWTLNRQKENYENGGKFLSDNILRKEITELKKSELEWLSQVSRKYYKNNGGENRYQKSQNILKLEQKLRLIHRRISNIRNNNLHQITNEIVKTKSSKIVMEDLNVKGMMKNRHLSKAIAEQNFHKFVVFMKYKCKFNGIEFIQVPRFYPSSKTCSCCGSVKKNLKLSDRIFSCECGNKMDRDLNASINLRNYRVS